MLENNNENSESRQHYLYITSSYPAETYIQDGMGIKLPYESR